MSATQAKVGAFEKVGECLYRYRPTGKYYARLDVNGKEVRRSLGTEDRATAKRKLGDLRRDLVRIDASAGRHSLAALCDRYLSTVGSQAAKTLKRKRYIAQCIKTDWPGGADVSAGKVVPSQVAAWLNSYTFGVPSYNLFLEFIRAVFEMAVDDRIISDSPVARIKTKARKKPIRPTPSFEEFQAIVASIRAQVYSDSAADTGDFVEFLGLAGLGQAEAGALRWGDVDWPNERITTFRQKTSRGFMVPLFPQLRPLLERLREARGGAPLPSEPVFRIKDAKAAMITNCSRLGLAPYTQRSLRRMFITRALEKGVDVKVIAEWQGHRDGGKLILDTYSHVRPVHSARMALLME